MPLSKELLDSMNVYNTYHRTPAPLDELKSTLQTLDQKHIAAVDEKNKDITLIANMDLDPALDAWKAEQVSRIKGEIENMADAGNYAGTMDNIKKLATDFATDPVTIGYVKNSMLRKEWLENLKKMDIPQDTKDWLQSQPISEFNAEINTDENGNPVSVKKWEAKKEPVPHVGTMEFYTSVVKVLNEDGYTDETSIITLSDGTTVTLSQYLNSIDKYKESGITATHIDGTSKKTNERLSFDKIQNAFLSAVAADPKKKESLIQEFNTDIYKGRCPYTNDKLGFEKWIKDRYAGLFRGTSYDKNLISNIAHDLKDSSTKNPDNLIQQYLDGYGELSTEDLATKTYNAFGAIQNNIATLYDRYCKECANDKLFDIKADDFDVDLELNKNKLIDAIEKSNMTIRDKKLEINKVELLYADAQTYGAILKYLNDSDSYRELVDFNETVDYLTKPTTNLASKNVLEYLKNKDPRFSDFAKTMATVFDYKEDGSIGYNAISFVNFGWTDAAADEVKNKLIQQGVNVKEIVDKSDGRKHVYINREEYIKNSSLINDVIFDVAGLTANAKYTPINVDPAGVIKVKTDFKMEDNSYLAIWMRPASNLNRIKKDIKTPNEQINIKNVKLINFIEGAITKSGESYNDIAKEYARALTLTAGSSSDILYLENGVYRRLTGSEDDEKIRSIIRAEMINGGNIGVNVALTQNGYGIHCTTGYAKKTDDDKLKSVDPLDFIVQPIGNNYIQMLQRFENDDLKTQKIIFDIDTAIDMDGNRHAFKIPSSVFGTAYLDDKNTVVDFKIYRNKTKKLSEDDATAYKWETETGRSRVENGKTIKSVYRVNFSEKVFKNIMAMNDGDNKKRMDVIDLIAAGDKLSLQKAKLKTMLALNLTEQDLVNNNTAMFYYFMLNKWFDTDIATLIKNTNFDNK